MRTFYENPPWRVEHDAKTDRYVATKATLTSCVSAVVEVRYVDREGPTLFAAEGSDVGVVGEQAGEHLPAAICRAIYADFFDHEKESFCVPECGPDCPGLYATNLEDDRPPGWVEIQQCGMCGKYEENEAPLAVSRKARWYDRRTHAFGPDLSKHGECRHWLSFRTERDSGGIAQMVPVEDARAFGLEVPDEALLIPELRAASVAASDASGALAKAAAALRVRADDAPGGDMAEEAGMLFAFHMLVSQVAESVEKINKEYNG